MQQPSDSPLQNSVKNDACVVFNAVWSQLEAEFGIGRLQFPKEVFWLNGAPGAGKGTHTEFIMRRKHLTAKPISVGDLLQAPEFKKLKDEGLMVGDKEVTYLVLRQLLDASYVNGAIVDGYPRTHVQVECTKLFYEKLNEVHTQRVREGSAYPGSYRPHFHIVVLFVDEDESVARQIKRGRRARQYNMTVGSAGSGRLREVRNTDTNEDIARKRYAIFKEETYRSLQGLRDVFPYHFINAHGSIREVQSRIVKELAYQSSLELAENTYAQLSPIPIASHIIKHARQELIRRLDNYAIGHAELFRRVIAVIHEKFMPVIQKHAISGMALITCEYPIFEDSLAVTMLIDIFSERGYHAVADVGGYSVPERMDPQTYTIHNTLKSVYRFRITFPGTEIRV